MMKPEVIIYDCDGVLVDSRKSNEAFFNFVLREFDIPPLTTEQLNVIYSWSARNAIDFLIPSKTLRQEVKAYMKAVDNSRFIPLMSVEPHIKDVIANLRKEYKFAVATNRGKSVSIVLEIFGMEGLFDITISSMDVEEPKPHPECLLKILKHFGVSPHESLYIGDGEVDSVASQRAGIPFLAYKNPSLSALHYLDDHRELFSVLSRKKMGKK
jgi:phosphoglycolate phosphatase